MMIFISVYRHENFLHNIIEGKMMCLAAWARQGIELLHIARDNGRDRLWTVVRFSVGQIKMETG